MQRTFYVTPRQGCQSNKYTQEVFLEGYSYPVLDILIPELGGNIRLVIAAKDGTIIHRRTNEVAVVGFEPKAFGTFDEIVFQPMEKLEDLPTEEIKEIKTTNVKGAKK